MKTFESNELERILNSEDPLEPMIGFSTRVMRAVHEEAAAPPPLVFPWARFLSGFLLSAALLVGAATWILVTQSPSPSVQPFPTEWFADRQFRELLWAGTAMVGSGLLAWMASHLAAPRHPVGF